MLKLTLLTIVFLIASCAGSTPPLMQEEPAPVIPAELLVKFPLPLPKLETGTDQEIEGKVIQWIFLYNECAVNNNSLVEKLENSN